MEPGGTSEAVILVKAAMHAGKRDDEIIYCAGVTPQGEWVRLAPVSFKKKTLNKSFKRWDRVSFKTEPVTVDARPESRRVIGSSMELIGPTTYQQRQELLKQIEVRGLSEASAQGKSLVLLVPQEPKFSVRKKEPQEIAAEKERFAQAEPGTRVKPFGYRFVYEFTTDEGRHEAVFADWETNETFSNLSKSFGEPQTVAKVNQLYGRELPGRGLRFVMSRDGVGQPWAIHAVICMDEVEDMSLGNLNMVV